MEVSTRQHQQKSESATSAMPLISIVMGTYNGSLYLLQQLESILAQTYPNIEIIVVDDCSTDDTMQFLTNFQLQYNRIKIFRNQVNLGYIKNFEKGCVLASGEMIALSDQDDYWQPQKLEKMYRAIGAYPMIFCDSEICDENLQPMGNKLSDRINYRNYANCLQQTVFGRVPGHAILFKKSLLNKCLPFNTAINHDWWLSFTATTCGGIKYLPEPLVCYRQHNYNLFGAVGNQSKKKAQPSDKEKKRRTIQLARDRVRAFYNFCPDELVEEKQVLRKLDKAYRDFSLVNNFQRMRLFFRYSEQLQASKKRSAFRKYLFCVKMFVMIK